MTTNKPVTPCTVCQKRTTNECAHIECPNRKRITANIPDHVSQIGMGTGGYYRITYQDK